MTENNPLEERLRAHLARVGEQKPSPDFEARLVESVKRSRWSFSGNNPRLSLAATFVLVLIVALVLAYANGRQLTNLVQHPGIWQTSTPIDQPTSR